MYHLSIEISCFLIGLRITQFESVSNNPLHQLQCINELFKVQTLRMHIQNL